MMIKHQSFHATRIKQISLMAIAVSLFSFTLVILLLAQTTLVKAKLQSQNNVFPTSSDLQYIGTDSVLAFHPSSAVQLDRRLIKVSGNGTLYWLQNNKYYGVISEAVLNAQKSANVSGWSLSVTTVSSLAPYTPGPDFISSNASSNGLLVSQVGGSGAGTIYRINNGKKEAFTSQAQFQCRGFANFNDVIETAASLLTMPTETIGDFTVTANPPSQTIKQGETATYTITVQSQSCFNSEVSLFALNLPTGFVPQGTGPVPMKVTPGPNNSVTSMLNIVTNTGTQTGTFTTTIQGTSGSISRSTQITLKIDPAPVVVNDKSLIKVSGDTTNTLYWLQNGKVYGVISEAVLNAQKSANVQGWSSSVTTVPSLAPYTKGPNFISADSSSNGLLVSQVGGSGAGTIYRINNGKKEAFTSQAQFQCRGFANFNDVIETAASLLTMPTETIGDFTVTANPPSQTIKQGETAGYTITVQSQSCFNSEVSLFALNLPPSYVPQGTDFNPKKITPTPNGSATTTLSIVTNTITQTGTFTTTVEGRSGSLIANKTISLSITPTTIKKPTITAINPPSVILNQVSTLTISGADFQSNFRASVTTSSGTYAIDPVGLKFISSSEVKVDVKMGGISTYIATLTITNPDGQTASSPFQVIEAPLGDPTITNITPSPVPYNQVTTLTVNGSNFQSGFAARVTSPDGTFDIGNTGLSFISPNKVLVQVLMKGAPPYNAELTILNPNGKSVKSSFQVTKPIVNPSFNIQPISGPVGTTFTNVGRNFTPFGEVRIKVKWANGSFIDGILKQADGNGYFSYDYTSQPGDPLGTHTLEVTDVASGRPPVTAQETFLGSISGDASSVTNETIQAKAGSRVTIRWRIKNTGATTWNNNYKLVFVASPSSGIPSQNLTTQGSSSYAFPATFIPGQEGDLPLDLKAPALKGTYYSVWQLQNAQGQPFGAQFYAQVTVIESNKSNIKNGNPSGNLAGDSPSTNAKTESDPVNTANGNYVYDREDLRVPGRGLDFVFSRTYNSADNTPSSLGNGWSHSFNINLLDTTSNPVVRYSDGKALEYEVREDGVYHSRLPGFYDTLVKNSDGSWALRKTDQRSYNFDASGKLVSIQDRNNNLISLSYDGTGKLQDVTDTVGRKFVFGYDGQRLSLLTDPINRTLQFSYDSAGNLVSFRDANGNTIRYEYDANSRVTRIIDGRQKNLLVNEYDTEGRVKAQTNGRGFKWSFSYDTTGRVSTITDPFDQPVKDQHDEYFNLNNTTNRLGQNLGIGYDTNGNLSQAQDLKGAVYGFSYDTRGNLTSIVSPNQTTRQIEYDVKNNPMKVTDELSRPISMEYDQKGNLTKLKDALNQASLITYNSFGQPVTITDPNGNQTKLEYDNQGNLKKITDALNNATSYEYDGVGRRTKVVNGRGKATSIFYDANDNVVNVVAPLGNVIAYNYDQNNNLVTIRDARGITTAYTYDENNLLIRERDDRGKFIEHTYDRLDRRISTKDKRGNLTEFGYDKEGRLVSVKDANGFITGYEYDDNGNRTKTTDPIGQATEFTYDSLNRLTKIKDPLGNIFERKYDAAGQLKEEIDQRGNSTKFDYDLVGNLLVVTDAAMGLVKYSYDKNRNRISVTDPKNNTSLTTFDKLNRVEATSDPLNNKYTYTYDEVGNRKTRTDAKQQITKYDYDDNNRLIRITYPDNKTVNFKYDEDSNIIEMADSVGVTKYMYDDLNRVTSYTDAYGKTIGYQYDENGNLKVLVYPDGKQVTYEYDKGNRMISVTDWLGKKTSYEYDQRNLVSKITNGNGTTTTYTYDNAGRLTKLVNAKSDGTVISSYTYVLDKNGNRLSVTIQEPLTLQVTTSPQSAAFDKANRVSRAGASTFTFDANGNTTGRTTSGVATAFAYDFEDRLIGVGSAIQYFYNGAGVRLGRRIDSKATRYVVDVNRDLSQLLCETDANGNITSYFVYGLGLLNNSTTDGKQYYYHYDSLGSTIATSDVSQRIVNKYAYDSTGKIKSLAEEVSQPFQYVGQFGVMQEVSGLLFMRARYYLTDIGRFITKDLIEGSLSDTQSLNLFAYTSNNFINAIDPRGLCAVEVLDFGAEYAKTAKENAWKPYDQSKKCELISDIDAYIDCIEEAKRLQMKGINDTQKLAQKAPNVVYNECTLGVPTSVGGLVETAVPDNRKAKLAGNAYDHFRAREEYQNIINNTKEIFSDAISSTKERISNAISSTKDKISNTINGTKERISSTIGFTPKSPVLLRGEPAYPGVAPIYPKSGARK